MQQLLTSAKKHKVSLLLLIVIGILLAGRNDVPIPLLSQSRSASVMYEAAEFAAGAPMADMAYDDGMAYEAEILPPAPPVEEYAPVQSQNRLITKNTTMSLVVSDVSNVVSSIEQIANTFNGFLVSSNLSIPEGASSGSITIRVPSESLDTTLDQIRSQGVRVVSENVTGRDVTDEFLDLQARLDVLQKTKGKFEELLDRGENVTELLQVQRELINLQTQIDNLKGRAQYLEQTARLSLVTVYLSTDELALPYTPDEVWRPHVVFRKAVRSLISSVRSVIDTMIWIGVYGVIWLPVTLLVMLIRRHINRKKPPGQS